MPKPTGARARGPGNSATFVFSLALAAAAAAGAAQAQITMKVACNGLNDVQHEWVKLYAARVEERAKGRIKTSTHPGGQLGTTPRMIEAVQLGSVEAYTVPAENFVGLDQRFQITGAPGWYRDLEHAKKTILDPRVREPILKLGEPKGLKGISVILYGPISYASRQPIRTPDDFKGRKVRVAASKLQEVPLQKLGATPVPIPLGEVLPALQQGTVDAVRLSINLFNNFKYYDVTKTVTLTEEAVFVTVGVLSKVWFDKLPPDLQAILVEEAAKLNEELSNWSLKQFAGASDEWKRHGGEIIRFSAPDQARFMKTVMDAGTQVMTERPAVGQMYKQMIEVANQIK